MLFEDRPAGLQLSFLDAIMRNETVSRFAVPFLDLMPPSCRDLEGAGNRSTWVRILARCVERITDYVVSYSTGLRS